MVALGADDKKKLYVLLVLAGILGIVVAVVLLKPGSQSSDTSAGTPTATNRVATGPKKPPTPPTAAPGTTPARPGGAAPTGNTSSGASPGGTASDSAKPLLINIPRYRPDPFKPFYTPTLPPPPPPKPLPPPVLIPPPTSTSRPINLPPVFGASIASSTALTGLPPVSIPSSQPSGPSALPPANVVPPTSTPLRSPNKRLSGVILGDSIYALLEIRGPTQTISRVVQPGDEVEGIKILRIERLDVNGVQTTRMTVLENGQERFFDLEPSPQPPPTTLNGGDDTAGGNLRVPGQPPGP